MRVSLYDAVSSGVGSSSERLGDAHKCVCARTPFALLGQHSDRLILRSVPEWSAVVPDARILAHKCLVKGT